MNDINSKTKKFENSLITLINTCELPACIVRLELQQALSIVIDQESKIIAQEQTKGGEDNGTALHENDVGE